MGSLLLQDRRSQAGLLAVVLVVVVVLSIALPELQGQAGPPAGEALKQSYYTVTLTNDTSVDASFDVWVWDQYTDTLQHLGLVPAFASTVVTLPIEPGYRYTFRGAAQRPGGRVGYHDTHITAERIVELGHHVNFMMDDMQGAVLRPEEWPTETPPADLEVDTPTPGPSETPLF